MKKAVLEESLILLPRSLTEKAITTLSKSSDISISNTAIELKTEIEKIREQIQNIE